MLDETEMPLKLRGRVMEEGENPVWVIGTLSADQCVIIIRCSAPMYELQMRISRDTNTSNHWQGSGQEEEARNNYDLTTNMKSEIFQPTAQIRLTGEWSDSIPEPSDDPGNWTWELWPFQLDDPFTTALLESRKQVKKTKKKTKKKKKKKKKKKR